MRCVVRNVHASRSVHAPGWLQLQQDLLWWQSGHSQRDSTARLCEQFPILRNPWFQATHASSLRLPRQSNNIVIMVAKKGGNSRRRVAFSDVDRVHYTFPSYLYDRSYSRTSDERKQMANIRAKSMAYINSEWAPPETLCTFGLPDTASSCWDNVPVYRLRWSIWGCARAGTTLQNRDFGWW